jgi:hypothetical protein
MKHTIKSSAIFIFIFLISFVAAAQTNYEDVVYLKSGSIIHGTIIEQIPNESIKIQTRDKNIFVFKIDEVMKITKEEVKANSSTHRESKRSFREDPVTNDNFKKSGYTNITEFTFGMSTDGPYHSSNNNSSTENDLNDLNRGLSIGVQSINGYQFSPHMSAGVGLGLQTHTSLVLVPIFLDVHANFIAKKITPFVSLAAGYSYTLREIFGFTHLGTDTKGGLMVSPAAGVKFFVKQKMALNVSLGFRYQEIDLYHSAYYSYNSSVPEYYSTEPLRHFILRFGFTF